MQEIKIQSRHTDEAVVTCAHCNRASHVAGKNFSMNKAGLFLLNDYVYSYTCTKCSRVNLFVVTRLRI